MLRGYAYRLSSSAALLLLILWGFLFLCVPLAGAQVPPWPDPNARWSIEVLKIAGAEMTDPHWGHLHYGHSGETSLTVQSQLAYRHAPYAWTDIPSLTLQVRYVAHWYRASDASVQTAVLSGWLTTPPYSATIDASHPALAGVPNGIHALSVEVQGLAGPGNHATSQTMPQARDFKPYPMFLHMGAFPGVPTSTWTPLLPQNAQDAVTPAFVPEPRGFVDASSLAPRAFPANPAVTPWHSTAKPFELDLYVEPLTSGVPSFSYSPQMLWEEPPGTPSAGLRFVRAFPAKSGEQIEGLWDNHQSVPSEFGPSGHRSFPVKDGPAGIGWTNGYTHGAVRSDGVFFFVNLGGQVRALKPDGELVTIVGWRVKPDKAPVWVLKPLDVIRQNMEFRGTCNLWPTTPTDTCFHHPSDLALDPVNPNRLYVSGFYDHGIYQVDVDPVTWQGTVSTVAGEPPHGRGYVDGVGPVARFAHPYSLVVSLDGQYLYVSDEYNHAIRRIHLATRTVTTLLGGVNHRPALQGKAGVTCDQTADGGCYPASATRPHVQVTVTAAQAAAGARPSVYYPQVIRIASTGELVLFDRGLNTTRAIDPTTFTARVITQLNDGGFYGVPSGNWHWLDVDRWGNSGELDAVYWNTFVSYGAEFMPDGPRFNEQFARTSFDGTRQSWVFGPSRSSNLYGFGPLRDAAPPHYPWAMSVDPRGALLAAGSGGHGIFRIRARRASDPVPFTSPWPGWPSETKLQDMRWMYEFGGECSPLSFYYETTCQQPQTLVPSNALAMRSGYVGHNLIGLPDAWDILPSWTDDQIAQHFGFSAALNQNAKQAMAFYLRGASGGRQAQGPPPPPPVDCVVSAWSAWVPGPWSACVSNMRTRTETRTRTVVTQPANGGAACPVLSEQQVVSEACVSYPSPITLPSCPGTWTLTCH